MSAQALAQPIPFGDRYRLLELLAVGGMAEIYRARQDAMAGFEKDIVIKRLKPELAADPRMVDMFLDEARISALLNHPNIVHIYDVGEEGGAPYIAMELIRGEELTNLCRRGLALGNFLPLPHAVDVIRQAANGMGYYHAKRDAGGESLDIIHCDISPNNLLITEDGWLKIIDFGIARARNQRYRDHGALPGKVSYMSPEQSLKESLDHRSDIFALGVVLYEITVGKRLFKGRADEVVRRVRDCDIKPPTFVRREYPGALESIVMRALEQHRADRYESAYDMAEELDLFLREHELKSGPLRVARYLDHLAAAAGGERRRELIAESERNADLDGEELDFDRGMFDSFQASVGGSEADAAEWDELEEDTEEIAAALGVDVDQLDKVGARVSSSWQPPEPDEVEIEKAPEAEGEAKAETEDEAATEVEAEAVSGTGTGTEKAAEKGTGTEKATETKAAAAASGFGAIHWALLLWALAATAAAVAAFVK